MRAKTADFAASLGLDLTAEQLDTLARYADLVWEKKDFLNLTSVANKEEIFTRHICDGLAAAAFFQRAAEDRESFTVADMGAGAGYVGLACASVLPRASVTLVESLEKRCSFLNWAVLKLSLKNVRVLNRRLGQQKTGPFDFITERAMGQINDILPLMAPALAAGGVVAAYQSAPNEAREDLLRRLGLRRETPASYRLPGEKKQRYLAVFTADTGAAA